jgi:hypothetical protein
MESANPFAQVPATPEPIIAQVRRQLRAEAGGALPHEDSRVDGVVDRVVHDLWGGRVKTFVPVLALREARDLLHVSHAAVPGLAAASAAEATATAAAVQRPARDVMPIEHDALPLDRRDVLSVDGSDILPR